jgi:hypothetical protein
MVTTFNKTTPNPRVSRYEQRLNTRFRQLYYRPFSNIIVEKVLALLSRAARFAFPSSKVFRDIFLKENCHSSRNSQRKPAKTVILIIGDEEAASENRDPEVNPKGTSPRSRRPPRQLGVSCK